MSDSVPWLVAAASVTGAGHLISGGACQDAHAWRITGRGELVVVVCDGAGSSRYGGEAARFVASTLSEDATIDQLLESFVDETVWRQFVQPLFARIKNDLFEFVASIDPASGIHEFACTVQLLVATASAVQVAHIGDGRAAARFDGSNGWQALFVPDRGDAANETIFLSTDIPFDDRFWEKAAVVIPGRANAVALMTDGCEMAAFECYVPDDSGIFLDPNRPFPGFFEPVAATLNRLGDEEIAPEALSDRWTAFITDGLPRFRDESDDRTMVFAVRRP